jgi:glycosyltransferase involved in cell wall biosynthesis
VNFRFTRSRLLIGLFRRLEDGCLAAADAVITISPALAEYAIARVREPRRHFLIENSLFDPLRLRQGPREGSARRPRQGSPDGGARRLQQGPGAGPARANARDEGDDEQAGWLALLEGPRPVVLYAGTFESYQGIELLLEAFACLRARGGDRPARGGGGCHPDRGGGGDRRDHGGDDDDATTIGGEDGLASGVGAAATRAADPVLLLLGGRPDQVERCRAQAAQLGLLPDDCLFAGQVSRDLAQRATRAAAVLTSPRTAGSNTPLKIYEQIASGVPLVATRIGSHTQVLADDDCFLVDPDPGSMASGLAAALAGGEDVERCVAAARRLYEERYSPAAYRDKMRRLLALVAP